MPKVFISYRHTQPDEQLAVSLTNHLKADGIAVFIDQKMLTGTNWIEEIDRQLRSSDFLVVLLSKESIRSAMVRQEIEIAHELRKQRGDKFKILPIRVDFLGALPYDLAAYLNPIQYSIWKTDDPVEAVADQILAAIRHSTSLPHASTTEDEAQAPSAIHALAEATEAMGAPLPAADPRFMLESGAVKFDSPYYIRRDSDEKFEALAGLGGQTIIVKAPRQFGKSSLLSRADVASARKQQQAFYFDFQFVDSQYLENLGDLMHYIARKLARHFKTRIKPDEFWDDELGAKDNITDFLEEALLAEIASPVLLLFDEVDRLFNSPFRDDFFAAVRGWHNLRARKSCWNHLNLVIAHSTEPHLWIQDVTQSPFNVGVQIRLEGFDFAQASTLNVNYGKPLKAAEEIQALLDLVGGHPFLLRQSLYSLVDRHWKLPELEREATSDTGPFGDHLRRFLWSLEANPGLRASVIAILRNGKCDDEKHFQRLSSAGLVRGETRNTAQMWCRLYQEYFSKHL